LIKRIVLLPDIHHPHHNKLAINAVFKFIKYFKPHAVNIMGDAMNMDAVNHWKLSRGSNKYFENKRLSDEYQNFDDEILTPLEKILPKHCDKVFMGGNHEYWIDILLEKMQTLIGSIEVEKQLRLKERDWQWIPWVEINREEGTYRRGTTQYGKLLVFHGQYTNKYHAYKTVDTYSKSCAYCHVHDVQMHTKTTVDDHKGFHTAQSIGCLCNKSPEFMGGRMNRWVNAFGVLYVREDGNYNLYVPIIINGQFCFDGKVFDGNK